MNLAIGAVFRNELDYILEWVCWHRLAGFKEFYIADNGSNDGTRELLEALSDIGLVKLLYQPIIEKHAQIMAYQRITQASLNKSDAILFIDADEFLIHESMVDGAEYLHLSNLLQNPNVGAISINWRCFGSSALESQDERPVLERFTWHLKDSLNSKNGHLKSISKTKYIMNVGPHICNIYDLDQLDCCGDKLTGYISLSSGFPESVEKSGIISNVPKSQLRINHYVIKSKQEFFGKKEKRGDVMRGPSFVRGLAYFEVHDFKDEEFYIPTEKIQRLKESIKGLWQSVQESSYGRNLRGSIYINNQQMVRGWLSDQKGSSQNLKVNIFVNSVYQGSAECGFYRHDLKEKSISKDGFSEFRYTHPMPLKSGDKVEIFVHANNYKFPQNASVEIN